MTIPNNLLVGLGAAVVMAAGLMASRGTTAGSVVGALAVFGLVVRWSRMPPVVLLAMAYLSFFPEGIPFGEPVGRERARPNLLDLLTVGAAVAYVAGHYRHLHQSTESGDEPSATELTELSIGLVAALVTACLAFYLVTTFQPNYARGPLRFLRVEDGIFVDAGSEWPILELVFARGIMLAGLIGFAALAAGLVLWLVRLNRLSPAEAKLVLLDVQWHENRRELARLETWRAAVRQPEPPRPKRGCRSCVVALLMGGAAFLLFLCLINRVRY